MKNFRPRAPSFDSPVRRRARQLSRLGAVAATPSMYPAAPMARAFWYDGMANFGDALTPWLLRRAGVIPVLETNASANLAGVGSILEMLPADFSGSVWGSGLLRGATLTLPRAQFLAVRGELTRDLVSAPGDVALGDPGILVSRFMSRPRVRWRLGMVPHHMHETDALWAKLASASSHVRLISVKRGPTAVLRDIASCEAIMSTSLHGLITADAFGIPAVWTTREPDLIGRRFKFNDYESALTPGQSRTMKIEDDMGLKAVLAQTATVDPVHLRERQDSLLRVLGDAPLPHVSPLTAPKSLLHRS